MEHGEFGCEGKFHPATCRIVNCFWCPLSTMWCNLLKLVKKDSDIIDIAKMHWIESMTRRKRERDWEDYNVVILEGGVGFGDVIGERKGVFIMKDFGAIIIKSGIDDGGHVRH